jgi:PIN domain nuclease of toxin-antitoxin system
LLLLDTQMVIWLADETDKIPAKVLRAMADASSKGGGLAIASVTLLEIALLAAKGKVIFLPNVEKFLEKVEASYHVLPLDRRIALKAVQLSNGYPKDPADRQIGATAFIHGLTLATADEKILKSGEVACI